jgi:hypothetical protein
MHGVCVCNHSIIAQPTLVLVHSTQRIDCYLAAAAAAAAHLLAECFASVDSCTDFTVHLNVHRAVEQYKEL